ncbi:group-specific protein [Lysinibacillus xylanilyticus]|uniref:group-specific protein n=1 Tax=Lysinibacillus xylanilyticus TaxID=582475 RepID=UPI0009F5D231|nr:group-specific protein [Lysinibacillus xylanilyticus]
MNSIITVSIDKAEMERLVQKEIKAHIQEINSELVFWDLKELCRRTCMSRPFVLKQFFYHPDFPKFKVGTKWLMPSKETEEFLRNWLKQHPHS